MTIDELEKNLAEATGPSRYIDGLIALAFGWAPHFAIDDEQLPPDWAEIGGHWLPPDKWTLTLGPFRCDCFTDTHFEDPPHYTSSLDAAVSLHKAVLPTFILYRACDWPGTPPSVELYGTHRVLGKFEMWHNSADGRYEAKAATLPLAYTLAIIRALKAERKKK